jgi:uncharacterized protein (DUF3084 family)
MSASTLVSHGLRINNPHRQIEKILTEQKDVSIYNKKSTLQRITEELESSFAATSISENKAQQIENILYARKPLIKERNSILDSFFKYYNPFYWKKLKKIDARLDELDLQLYVLESEVKQIESDIDKAIESAQERLKNILETSTKVNFLNQ